MLYKGSGVKDIRRKIFVIFHPPVFMLYWLNSLSIFFGRGSTSFFLNIYTKVEP